MNTLHRLFRCLLLPALTLLALTSCVEQSVVVKVNKDGTGIIHERTYTNDAMGQMMAGFATEEGVEVEEESNVPSEEELKENAARMGEGVSLQTFREGKNKSGWSGYEVIYEFQDVNKLKITMSDFAAEMGEEMAEEALAEAGATEEEEVLTFELAGDVLKVHSPDPTTGLPGGGESGEGEDGETLGTEDPFANLDPSNPESAMAIQMMAGMTAGMRMGLFILPGDPIVETNAKHRNGDMVTLFLADMGQIFQDPANLAKMQAMQEEADRESMQEVIDGVDGMTADLQSPITIQFE